MTRHPKRRYSRPLKSARNLNRHFPRVKKFCPATSNFHISGSRRDISVIFFSNSLKNCADFHYNYCCIGSKTKMQLSYGCKSICYCCTILVSDGPLCHCATTAAQVLLDWSAAPLLVRVPVSTWQPRNPDFRVRILLESGSVHLEALILHSAYLMKNDWCWFGGSTGGESNEMHLDAA